MVNRRAKATVDFLLNGRHKNIPFLAVSIFLFPLSVCIVVGSCFLSCFVREPLSGAAGGGGDVAGGRGRRRGKNSGLTILVSGGRTCKALVHARQFARAGHRVVLCEEEEAALCATRFSNCVDKFYPLPDPLRSQDRYTEALLTIVLRERVDIFVPCCGVATTICDGVAKKSLDRHCTVLQFDEELGRLLDKKDTFMAACQLHGLEIPKTVTFHSADEVMRYDFAREDGGVKRRYVMKCIGVDDRTRNDMTLFPYAPAVEMRAHLEALNIHRGNPYIMQEYLEGAEYCCQSVSWQGTIRTYSACLSSDVLMNYRHIPPSAASFEGRVSQKMLDFATHFSRAMQLSGPVAFDFLLTASPAPLDTAQHRTSSSSSSSSDGNTTLKVDATVYDDGGRKWRLLPIECNPRTHTANTNFLGCAAYEAAYTRLAHDANHRYKWPVLPDADTRPTYWIAHELFNLCLPFLSTKPVGVREFVKRVLCEREAEWDLHDPMPFLACYHLQWPYVWLVDGLLRGRRWTRMNASTGKVFWLD